jgi:signal transduction histidine kinase
MSRLAWPIFHFDPGMDAPDALPLEHVQQVKTLPRRSIPIASSANLLALLGAGILLLNLLVISLATLSLKFSHAQYESRAIVATQNLAQVLEHDIAAAIDKVDLALLAEINEIARQIAHGGIDGQALNAFIGQWLTQQPDLESLRFANAQGGVAYGTGVEAGSGVSIADREYFTRLRGDSGAGLIISKPLLGRISGKWTIVLARRVNDSSGRFAGAVFATMSLEHFQQLFSALNLGIRGAVSLRDANLGLIARHTTANGADRAIGANWPVGSRTVSNELKEIVLSSPTAGTYIARTSLDGIERANAYRKVTRYPLYVIVGLATDDFLAPWRDEIVKTLMLAALFAVVTLGLSWQVFSSWKLREALARRVVAVQEEERRRLAAELHDNTSPNLSALSLNLGMIAADLPPNVPVELETRLADIRALLANTTAGIRDVCAYLRPAALDYANLIHALQEYAEQFSRQTGITVKVSGPHLEQRLAPDMETMLFRVVQEALTNCAKHANASAINIELAHDSKHATLTISDNGVGFDPKALGQSEHRPGLGLLSMRERVELAGGQFNIESHPEKGTRIRVQF